MRGFMAFIGLALCSQAAELRTWTDAQGRRMEAKMLGLEGESVMFEMKDGRKLSFPLAKLSAADVAYARAAKSTPEKPAGGGAVPNFDEPWPDRIKFSDDPEIATVKEDEKAKEFVYESANYRFQCNARLSKSVVKGFSVMFEATYLFCRKVPLALDGGERVDGKFLIRLFETMDEYLKAGGPAGSAGVFLGEQKAVLVPLESLGVRPVGSGYMLDRGKTSMTLPHELTHQLTPDAYYQNGAKGWFSEGLAEYVAVTPYRSGAFSVRGNHRDIVDYATGYGDKGTGGRALGKKIRMKSLKQFILQDYDAFTANPQLNYGCGLLITYYFLQMDGEGDGRRIKAFLKTLREGKTGDAALAVLLDGRSYEDVEKEISKGWSRRGIDLTFGDDP